jgi:hypothetical protein
MRRGNLPVVRRICLEGAANSKGTLRPGGQSDVLS